MLPSRSQLQRPNTVLRALQRQAITPQHLPLSDGGLPLLRGFHVMREALPTREYFRGHGIQHHHPIQTGMAMDSRQLLRHPATPPIAMGAHQSSASVMARQQPVATETLHRHQTIAKPHQAMGQQSDHQWEQGPMSAAGPCPE